MERTEVFKYTLEKLLWPVKEYLDDKSVSEIMINGTKRVFIERKGKIEETKAVFYDEEHLLSLARNIAQYTNKRITPTTSRFDSRLHDGSRVHVVMPRCSPKGLCISIRRFPDENFTLDGLVTNNSLTKASKEYIETVVALKKNIIISGGTGTGKTSFLNAISARIPDSERVIVIEDSSELRLTQRHVLAFETAWPDRNGEGATTIRDLLHSALRMRPDRIVIGECRGGEALDMLQAMLTGHQGSLSTLHANTAKDALNRLETMAMQSGIDITPLALKNQIASAIDVLIQLDRLDDGRRMVTEIIELDGLSNGEYSVIELFKIGTGKILGQSGRGLFWTENPSKLGPLLSSKMKDELVYTHGLFGVTQPGVG